MTLINRGGNLSLSKAHTADSSFQPTKTPGEHDACTACFRHIWSKPCNPARIRPIVVADRGCLNEILRAYLDGMSEIQNVDFFILFRVSSPAQTFLSQRGCLVPLAGVLGMMTTMTCFGALATVSLRYSPFYFCSFLPHCRPFSC